MNDTDKCKHILYDTMFNPIDVYDVAEELLAEVKRLREATQQIIGNIELWCNGNTVPKDILMEKLKEMIE